MSSVPSTASLPEPSASEPVFYVKPFFSTSVPFDCRLLSVSGLCKRDAPTELIPTYKQIFVKVALRSVGNYLDEFDLDVDHSACDQLSDLLLSSSSASEHVRHYVSLATWMAPDLALTPAYLQARIRDMVSSSALQPSFQVLVVFSGPARRLLRTALGLPPVSPLVPVPDTPVPPISSSVAASSALTEAFTLALTRLLGASSAPPSVVSAAGGLPADVPPISPEFRRSMGLPLLAVTPSAVLHRDPSTHASRVSFLPPAPGGSIAPHTDFGNLRRQPFALPLTPGSLPVFSLSSGAVSPSAPAPAPAQPAAPAPASGTVPSPAPAAPATTAAPPSDPAWHSTNRAGFSYPLGLSPLLADRSSLPPLQQGTTWQYFQCDIHAPDALIVNVPTGTIFPWVAPRPNYGVLVHHPICTSAVHMDRKLFLANLSNHGFDTRNHKSFQSQFPLLDPAAISNFPFWWNRVMQHTQTFGGFIPPLHTLRPHCPLGIWFEFLPPHIQADAQTTFADLLVVCIQGRTSGLSSSHSIIERLIRESTNGYWLLYELAIHAGSHPLLDDCPSLPHEPSQTRDMSLSAYVSAWRRYVHYAVLSGKFLSDRYFYHQFIRSLDPAVRSIIESRLDLDLRAFPLGTPLPLDFDPDRLLSLLTRYTRYAKRPDLIDKSPRELFRGPSTPVHSLATDTPDLLLAALDAGAARTCFICGAVDHLVADCPLLQKLRRDSTSRRLLSRLLQAPPRRDHRPSSASGGTALIRQMTSSAGEGLGAGEGPSSDAATADHADDTNSVGEGSSSDDSVSDTDGEPSDFP